MSWRRALAPSAPAPPRHESPALKGSCLTHCRSPGPGNPVLPVKAKAFFQNPSHMSPSAGLDCPFCAYFTERYLSDPPEIPYIIPILSGEIAIRIAADGNWYHEGRRFQRASLVKSFTTFRADQSCRGNRTRWVGVSERYQPRRNLRTGKHR
jgi:hypothetical protein